MYPNLLKLGFDEFNQDERLVHDRAYHALPYHA